MLKMWLWTKVYLPRMCASFLMLRCRIVPRISSYASYTKLVRKGRCYLRIRRSTVVLSKVRCVCAMKKFIKSSSKDWSLFRVCLSSVPMISLRLAATQVLAVMLEITAAKEHLRASTVPIVDQ